MSLRFEWDPDKAASNLDKHGISFAEAQTVFSDTLSATILDPRQFDEDRLVTIWTIEPRENAGCRSRQTGP